VRPVYLPQISLGYVFITLLVALLAPNVTPRPSIDAQTTVICAIAAVFSLFTGSMAVSHWVLILQGQSTIESMAIADMKHWESTKLNSAHGMLGLRAKRETKAAWDREWGPLDTEGNLWYRDSRKQNWTAVMGTRVLAWLIPPPKYRPDDGLSYLPNPRRGPDGKWIRRSEWPEELR
jgi:palmitoyltransferase